MRSTLSFETIQGNTTKTQKKLVCNTSTNLCESGSHLWRGKPVGPHPGLAGDVLNRLHHIVLRAWKRGDGMVSGARHAGITGMHSTA